MPRRHELTDAEWARLAPLLPPRKAGKPRQDASSTPSSGSWPRGRPGATCPSGTGPGRRCTPASGAGPAPGSGTVSSPRSSAGPTRPGRWTGSSTSSTAPSSEHTSTRPGPRGDPQREALGRSRGGFSTKVHLRADGHGQPLTVVLTPGPRVRPKRVVGDKGSTGRRRRAYCRRRGSRHTIARLRTARRTGPFDRAVYRLRHRVENLIARCKQFRSLATRYDTRAESYRTLWVIAFTILWIKHAH